MVIPCDGRILLVLSVDGNAVGKSVPSAAAWVRVCGCRVLVLEGTSAPSNQTRVGVVVLNKTVLACGVLSSGWVSEHAIITSNRIARINTILRDGRLSFINSLDFNRKSILYVHYNDFH